MIEPHEENESNDIGPFKKGLDKIDDSALPPNPEEKPESEVEIIKRVLRKLEEEYDVKIEVTQSGDLHTKLALNHRLDAVLFYSRSEPSEEMILALQANEFTDEYADELYDAVTHIKKNELATEEDLENLINSIHRLLEVVVVDPQNLFEKNLQSQSLILQALDKALTEVMNWKESKPERDLEEVNAKSSLLEEVVILKQLYSKWATYSGEMSPQFLAIFDTGVRILEKLIEQLDDNINEPRGQINIIRQKMQDVFWIRPSEPLRMEVNRVALDDVKTMIFDLRH